MAEHEIASVGDFNDDPKRLLTVNGVDIGVFHVDGDLPTNPCYYHGRPAPVVWLRPGRHNQVAATQWLQHRLRRIARV